MAVILNLPPAVRMNSENVILCGLWVGPPMKLFLKPVASCLKELSTVGLKITTPAGPTTIRGKLVLGVFDLPAKAAVLCCKQFNGKYGCSVCLHPGEWLSNNARVYPPSIWPEISHAQVIKDAAEAERTNTAVRGVMGMSPLAEVFDMVYLLITCMQCWRG